MILAFVLLAALERSVLPDLPHPRVDYWVERFSNGDKKAEIDEAFARMPKYERMIARKLRRRGCRGS